MIFLWILVALFIFSLVVLIHEWGHFYAARKFGVKVLEFWLGIPPKAKELFRDKKWTKYTLNWLPIWWFVMLDGEKYEKNEKVWKTKFYTKSYLQKSVILLAWVFMNFILASLIFSILFIIWIKPIWINTIIPTNLESKIIPTYNWAIKEEILLEKKWLILNPLKNSIAEKWWIIKWDILLKVNELEIQTPEELINMFGDNKWKIVELDIKENLSNNLNSKENNRKNWKLKKISLKLDENWKAGMYIWKNIEVNENFEYKYNVLDSVKYWFYETYIQSTLTLKWIWILARKIFNPKNQKERDEAIDSISWPIWIVDLVSSSMSNWIIFLSIITAVISINLAIFNMLPIPALDWWRFLLLTINTFLKKVSRWKIKTEKFENIIHFVFFIFLILLTLLISYNDIEKIINR